MCALRARALRTFAFARVVQIIGPLLYAALKMDVVYDTCVLWLGDTALSTAEWLRPGDAEVRSAHRRSLVFFLVLTTT